MIFRRFSCVALIPLFGLGLLSPIPVSADTVIPGGANSNPTTNNGQADPLGPKPPSLKDSNPPEVPPKPAEPKPEDDKGCEQDDEDPKNPDGMPPIFDPILMRVQVVC